MNKILRYILTFTVILTVCWAPLNKYILGFDAAGRIVLSLLLMSCIFIFPFIVKAVHHKPIKIYLFLAIYMFLNVLYKGTNISGLNTDAFIFFINIFTPILILLITTYLSNIDYNYTIKVCVVSLMLYTILCIFNETSVEYEGRIGSEINPNTIALNASFAYLLIFYLYVRKQISKFKLAILSVIPVYAIFATGSRMAFIIVALVTFVFVLSYDSKTESSYIKKIVFFIVFMVSLFYVLNHTYIGERLLNTTSQIEETDLGTGITIFDSFGDRGIQYYNSFPIFLSNFMTGIGLNHWAEYNPTGHVCHSEYLTMYLENGIVGLILYLIFLGYFIKSLRRIIKKSCRTDGSAYFLFYCFCGIGAINLVFWTYDSYACFMTYALTISLISSRMHKTTIIC